MAGQELGKEIEGGKNPWENHAGKQQEKHSRKAERIQMFLVFSW